MQITIQEANAAMGSIHSAYNGIILKGFYLPKRQCSIITADDLFRVMTNRFYRIKLSEVKIGQLISKSTLICFERVYYRWISVNFGGFDEEHIPDKTWIVNVLFTLNPNHTLFNNSVHDCLSILTSEDLKIIQPSIHPMEDKKQGRFFKRSKTQSIEYKQSLTNLRTSKKQKQVKQKKQQIFQLNKQIQELQNTQLQEEQQS